MQQGGSTARLGIVFDVPNAALAAQSLTQVAQAADNVADNATQAMLRTNAFGQSLRAPQQSTAAFASQVTGINQGLVEFIQRLDRSSDAAQRAARSFRVAGDAIKQGLASSVAEYVAAFEALEGRMATFGRGADARQFNPLPQGALGDAGGGNQLDAIDQGARKASNGFNALQAAVQGVAGGLAFFAANAVVSAVAGLAQIPISAARAEDSLAKLQARLRFAFRGSDAAARVAGASIMGIADNLGMDYNAVAQQYGDMAISGRAMGMSSGQVGGAVQSFGQLGMISGANQSQINGAMWQVQQMMNLGTLRFQDYRYMATNMGALDDVLAQGAGVPVSQLMTMISNGEVSAQKFFEYLEKGMQSLEDQAMTAPETMERSSARMANAWTRLLQDMGKAVEASSMVQSMQNLITKAIDGVRVDLGFGSPQERAANLAGRVDPSTGLTPSQSAQINQMFPMGVPGTDRERQAAIERARAENMATANAANNAAYLSIRERSRAREDERRNTLNAEYEAGLGVLANLQSLQSQRGQVESQINIVGKSIDAAQRMEQTNKIPDLEHALATLNAQLAAIVDPFTRALTQQGEAETALGRFGSRGSDLYMRAYEMDMAQAGTLERPGIDAALQFVLRQEVLGARGQQAQAMGQINAQRQFVLPSIGQDARAMAQAQVEAEIAALTQTYSELANDAKVQELIRIRREVLEGQNALDADTALARGQEQIRRERERIAAQLETVGDFVGRRRAMQQLDIEGAERQTPGIGAAISERNAQQDILTLAERNAQEERGLAILREQSGLFLGVGRERRIQLEILRQMRAEEESALPRSREDVELAVRRREEVQREAGYTTNYFDSIDRSGRRIGEGLENIFFKSVRDGLRRGKIEGEDILWGLVDIAMDIGQDIASALIRPFRDQFVDASTSFLDRFLSNMGVSRGKNLSSLTTQKLGGKSSAFGNAFVDGAAVPFAMGGVTASMGYFPMANGGIGSLAEAGAEAILPLARGPDGRLGVQNAGDGGGAQIVINDYRGADAEPVEVQERRGPDGRRMVEVTLRDSQRKNVAAGKTDQAMRSRYGAQPLVRQA